MRIRIRQTDLWCEYPDGWSENGAQTREIDIEVPDNLSDLAINRRIKKAIGIQGWKKDGWCFSDWGPWRQGSIGVYADTIEENLTCLIS